MAPSYEFKYFQIHGLGNMIRIILEDQGIEYQYSPVTFEEWRSKVKPTTPFGQVPVLVVDGKTQLSQSHAIVRYLARENGLMGSNSLETAQIDMYIDQSSDVRKKLLKMIYSDYEEGLKPFLESISEDLLPFENLVKSNSDKQFLLFGKLTAFDYVLFDLLLVLNALSSECLAKSPNLRAYFESFGARPKLRAYLDRPDFKAYKFTGSPHL